MLVVGIAHHAQGGRGNQHDFLHEIILLRLVASSQFQYRKSHCECGAEGKDTRRMPMSSSVIMTCRGCQNVSEVTTCFLEWAYCMSLP